MYSAIRVKLSTQPASVAWGESQLVSFGAEQAFIHVDCQADDALRRIQMAGRKLSAQGFNNVRLDGERWDTERRWAFANGFRTAKGNESLDWGELEASELQELNDLQLTTDWVRRMINGQPDCIYPRHWPLKLSSF